MQQATREIIDLTQDSDSESNMLPTAQPSNHQGRESSPYLASAKSARATATGLRKSLLSDDELAQLAAMEEVDPFWPFVNEAVDPLQFGDRPPRPASQVSQQATSESIDLSFTADKCLQLVLEIFPDVSHGYVMDLLFELDGTGDYEALPGPARFDNIVERLLANNGYPRQSKQKQAAKRKRQSSVETDLEWFEKVDRPRMSGYQVGIATALLKAEFPDVAARKIDHCMMASPHLYQTYITIANGIDAGDPAFFTGRRAQHTVRNLEDIARGTHGEELVKELQAARLKVATTRSDRVEADVKKRLEHENLKLAMERGETGECQACFDDLPLNRMIHCDGADAHFTCFSCAETYIRTEVGADRCRVICVSGCGQGYPYNQLQRVPNKPLLEKLARIEQQEAIRNAGLDDLEDCPFCDFKMEMPPVDQNFVFECLNPECGKQSCRRCRNASHLPVSCEQYAKEHKVSARHHVEEAMTAAMVRSCNKCEKKFIKDYGCNKMICPTCKNMQCYVCSQTITTYEHFTDKKLPRKNKSTTKCPLYDNAEERHNQEVEAAEAKAREEALADNPDISTEDLEIKMSDAVKLGEADRVKQAGPLGLGMVDDVAGLQRQNFQNGFVRAIRALRQNGAEAQPWNIHNGNYYQNHHRVFNHNHNHNHNHNNFHHHVGHPNAFLVPPLGPVAHGNMPGFGLDRQYNPHGRIFGMNPIIVPDPRLLGERLNRDRPPQVNGHLDAVLNQMSVHNQALPMQQQMQQQMQRQMQQQMQQQLQVMTNAGARQNIAHDLPGHNGGSHGTANAKNRTPQNDWLLAAGPHQAVMAGVPPPPIPPYMAQRETTENPTMQAQRHLDAAIDNKAIDQPTNWDLLTNGDEPSSEDPQQLQLPLTLPHDGTAGAGGQMAPHRMNEHATGHFDHRGQQAQPYIVNTQAQGVPGRAYTGRRD
ncbi:hypothetical protein K431DRAFT_282611 [Polychaeton citri CBS 116435]|uniref:RING-type domain-containing protein n=1 Tax=Polychaeton citri CBS 116435 TaxID=1314669 RepID=A0A9P4QB38_9PEZI|nr:hypothetical protein K431DRAFT_282611 [Polychaeton citri CBS 116435]